jgi:uncharacterized RDD family membrane protein YckC
VSPSRPPGWYTDSADPTRERWWDGGEWSRVTREAPQPPRQQAPPQPPRQQVPPPQPPRQAGWGAPPAPGQGPYGSPYGGPYGGPPQGGPQGAPGYGPYVPVKPAPTTPDGVPLADPMPRLLARLLDYVITTVIATLAGLPFLLPIENEVRRRVDDLVVSGATVAEMLTVMNEISADADVRRQLFLFQAVALLVSCVYTVTMVRLRGATVGKLAAGVRVRAWGHEGRPTWGQAFGRWVTREAVQVVPVIGLPYWVLDSFWLLWDQRRQCLHDKLPGTVVVRAR